MPSTLRASTLLAFGLLAAACGDPVKNALPKFPFELPKLDAGADDDDDATDDETCTGGVEVGGSDTRKRFQSATAPAGQTCISEEQTRTCLEDGTWSDWSGTYEISDCEVADAAGPCEDGATESREAWTVVETDAGAGLECVKGMQTRSCASGTWGGWSTDFPLAECAITFDACDGQPHGTEKTRKRFAAATVNPGQTCQEEVQTSTCEDGTWSDWTGTLTVEACDVLEFLKCGEKFHGDTENRPMYEATVSEPGEDCVEEIQTRTCNNGVWSDWVGEGEFAFTATYCDPAGERRCNKPGGGTLEHEEEYTYERFTTKTVPYNQECTKVTQTEACNDGTLPPYTGTATELSCSKLAPVGCADGNVTRDHGYQKTRTRWENSRVAVGALCKSEIQVSKCDNGTWLEFDGQNDWTAEECFHNCSEGGEHGAPPQTRKRYKDSSVAKGLSCTSVEQVQTRTCTDGVWGTGTLPGGWNGGLSYDELECRVRKSDCTTGGVTIFDGESLKNVRYRVPFPETACESQTQERHCNDGVLDANWTPRTLTYEWLACSKLPTPKDDIASCRWEDEGTHKPHCIEYPGDIGPGPELGCAAMFGDTDFEEGRGCPSDSAYATCEQNNSLEYHYVAETKNAVCFWGDWDVLN
jgi:hypothetical protein